MGSTPSIVAPGDWRSPTICAVTKHTTKRPADAWLAPEHRGRDHKARSGSLCRCRCLNSQLQ